MSDASPRTHPDSAPRRPTVAPLAWYGGKSRLAARIADLLPPHRTYVEPFGGAAAVLFTKTPATLEVYNDVDSGLVTFFRVLRDRPDELARALRLTPYSREEFTDCVRTWEQVEDDVERARRWYVRCRQAFAASSATVGWGYERTGATRGGTRSGSFATSVQSLERFAERFRRVQVEHLDWREVLQRYDGPAACFYLDPPYHPETRGRDRHCCYAHELETTDHDDLVATAVALHGSVLVSGYDHESYRPLDDAGFERVRFQLQTTASRMVTGRGARTEIIWRRLERGTSHALTLFAASDVEAEVG